MDEEELEARNHMDVMAVIDAQAPEGMEQTLESFMAEMKAAKEEDNVLDKIEYERYDKYLEENKDLLEARKVLCEKISGCADTIREIMLMHYNKHGVKKARCGVAIRLTKKLIYDVGVAFGWAKSACKIVVTPERLDVRAFEQMAKITDLDFVKIEEVPQATIPKIEVETK